MKKLMFAALGAAVTSGAFAAPLVYDYKASVKHMYSKPIRVRDMAGANVEVYQKYVQSGKLKGYLVVDSDGATSAELIADRGDANSLPPAISIDHGRNRAFLVVQNTSAKVPAGVNARAFRTAKILPANLEASFIDNNLRDFAADGRPEAKTGLAQGYLYVGGEFVAPVRPKLERLALRVSERVTSPIVQPAPAVATAGMAMVQDYVWQSYYLFGLYNSADFEGTKRAAWWQISQTAVDAGFEAGVQIAAFVSPFTGAAWAGEYFFHDTWMNGSGFGKFTRDSWGELCCGFGTAGSQQVLSTLSGNLKGGLFLCTYEGLLHGAAAAWLNNPVGWAWEDQWFTSLLNPPVWGGADQDQRDLWQDGGLELNTTDVITGTWSIKLRTRNIPTQVPTVAEISVLTRGAVPPAAFAYAEDSTGLTDLVSTLKGCALQLNNQTLFVATTGDADIPVRVAKAATHYSVPALTPAFAIYYGLANFK